MGLIDRMKRRFGRGAPEPAEPAENDLRIGDLAARLAQMRGETTTAMGPPGAAPRAADSVEQLSKAARDARFVDRTNEDDVLRGVEQYRSVDDR